MNEPKTSNTSARWSQWKWVAAGALYGVLLRIVVGSLLPHEYGGAMSIAFLLATPFVVGALTIYGFRDSNPTLWALIWKPWVTIALMMAGCAITLLEGSICIAILSPLFLVCGSLGGLAMGLALTAMRSRQSQLKVIAVLPFLLLSVENQALPLPDRELELTKSVVVNASPQAVWQQILTAKSIRSEELPLSLTHFIGVPKPVEGVNVNAPGGEIRYSRWERGVNFRALVTKRDENHSITWRYIFDENSFPEGSMDEHVVIGGRYFSLHDTTFNLHEISNEKTRLEIIAHYRIATRINFYAVPVATLLGEDFISTILELYKKRSERAHAVTSNSLVQGVVYGSN